MQAIIKPSAVTGTLIAPASKSAMQRACAAALLRVGKTILHNPGISDDDKAALDIVQQLGAIITQDVDTVFIESKGVLPASRSIHCGESGLSVRMFTSIAALSEGEITITGRGSLVKRPLAFFDETLPLLDVSCESAAGYLPLRVQGPLVPKDITIDGSLSSQFLTGLLMGYAAANASGVTITVKGLNSKPYIDLTLKIMAHFGLKVPVNNNYESFYFDNKPIVKPYGITINYAVESDWSGGAFLLVAAAISGDLVVKGLDVFSKQADKAVLQALMSAGVIMSIEEDQIGVKKNCLKAFHFNATDCPDLFPPLVALAAYCEGKTVIEGVHRLTHKESNRAFTLQEEFGKLGVEISLHDDLMIITGGSSVKRAVVSSHHDHRIAMACAVAALRASSAVTINDAEAVNKSYPQFWAHLQSIGAQVILKD
jgi:3-phosphoshikimate 1-carboxyvinyltransferase